jgi:hypothetical protein
MYGTEPACGYDNWISHVSEGQVSSLNIYAPFDMQSNDFGEYLIPTESQLAQWEAVILCWLDQDLSSAENLIQQYQFPYEAVLFQDLDSGKLLYILRETLNDDMDTNGTQSPEDDEVGSFDYGWGLYIFDPSASRPIIISVPHPCDDYPSPVMGLEAYLTLDARLIMIAGAGREVAYIPPYNSNNASISDPSRFEDHPFNVAYQRAADQIRALTGKMEFSLQVHTYDWNKYGNDSSVMLSAGNTRNYCALPIRDASRAQNDLIHHTPYIVFPQGVVENATDIPINQYYCVYYSSADPVRYIKDGHNVLIPYNRNLPGALENRQMLYTEPQNTYDVFSPFLHVEMDELPRFWEQTNANLRWFYGWNSDSQTWDISQRWTRFIQFYTPWLNALHACLDPVLVLDDLTGPSNPENLMVSDLWSPYYVTVAWDRCYSYDFDSYELRLRYFDGTGVVTNVLDRHNVPKLAWQLLDGYEMEFPQGANVLYVSILARDKHGNSSMATPETKIYRPSGYYYGLDNLAAHPLDGAVRLEFEGSYTGAIGYNVNRCSADEPWNRVASWSDHPELLVNAEDTYLFTDPGLTNGEVYSYQISVEYQSAAEFFDWRVALAQPQHPLTLMLTNISSGDTDSLRVAMNIMAEDGDDPLDELRTVIGSPPVAIVAWDPDEDQNYSLDVKASFDPLITGKIWQIKCFSAYHGVNLQIGTNTASLDPGWDFLLHDKFNGDWHDLRSGPYVWQAMGGQWRQFELCWGFKAPQVIIPEGPNIAQSASGPLMLNWQIVNPARLSHLDLKLVCSTDSVIVAENMPATTETYVFGPPADGILGARLVVEAHTWDGEVCRSASNWLLDLIPDQFQVQAPAGFSLVSIPIAGYSQPLVQMLGSNAFAWQMGPGSVWQPVSDINSAQGFLVHSPTPYQLSFPAQVDLSPRSLQLVQGWNLLPNPHYRVLNLSSLRFNTETQELSYNQMMDLDLLAPRAMVYTNSGWEDTDSVPPLQAFLLYLGVNGPISMTIDPLQDDGAQLLRVERWSARIAVTDGFYSGDAIRVGVADDASELIDPLYDLAKAPPFPLANLCLTLMRENPAGNVIDLQSEYRELYPDYDPVEKHWQFRLQVPVARTIAFSLDTFGMPEYYSVSVQVNDTALDIPAGQTRWWDPPSSGVYYGTVTVRSYAMPGFVPMSASKYGIAAWPNPFRESIDLGLSGFKGQEVRVAVYNIRGQKVTGLFSGQVNDERGVLHWDGRDGNGTPTAPGVYFIRVQSEGETVNHKVLRLRN